MESINPRKFFFPGTAINEQQFAEALLGAQCHSQRGHFYLNPVLTIMTGTILAAEQG